MTEKDSFGELLKYLDGSGSNEEFETITKLRESCIDLPSLLLEKYNSSKKWKERASSVYHAICYARSSLPSIQLGIIALSDKSYAVRYRACMLLACSLNSDVIPSLMDAECKATDPKTICDIQAAIDAIKNQNSDCFVDRQHTGKISLNVKYAP